MAAAAKQKDGIWETVKTVIDALLIAGVFRTLFFQPFWIPSGSMKDTLLIGDFLFVNKMAYGYSYASCPSLIIPSVGLNVDAEDICGVFKGSNNRLFGGDPERGDVVVFRHPVSGQDYIKRLIGLPGDDRFVSMVDAYDESLRFRLKFWADEEQITLHQGVYAWFSGPSFETPAEINAIRLLGADAVGMSTAPETIIARHIGLPVVAISCVTNPVACTDTLADARHIRHQRGRCGPSTQPDHDLRGDYHRCGVARTLRGEFARSRPGHHDAGLLVRQS